MNVVWFKLDMIIDTNELHFFLYKYEWALPLIQGYRDAGKQNFCAKYLTKFSSDLNEI